MVYEPQEGDYMDQINNFRENMSLHIQRASLALF